MSDSTISYCYYDKQGNLRVVRLDENEIRTINQWISSDFYTINYKQRKGIDLTEEEKKMVDDLSKAVKKLPRYIAKDDKPIYRVLDIENRAELEEFFKNHRVGRTIREKQFLSFSKEKGYNDDGNVVIIVYGCKKPRDLQKFNSAESEVLYELGQKFRVVDYEYDDGKYCYIYKEIDDD